MNPVANRSNPCTPDYTFEQKKKEIAKKQPTSTQPLGNDIKVAEFTGFL